jgi:hypothetical protein
MDPAMAAVTASRTSRAAALAAPSSNNDAPSGAAAAVGSAAAAVGGEVSASSAATGTSAPPLGGCQVFVNIVEGRSLSPRDRNGSADPLVKVVFDGQQQHTDTIDENLCPVWDETLVFDTDIQSAYQLDASSITFECWDADTVSDELIGAFELDLGQVWQSTDHELYRRWVALTDITGKHEGVQGYLRVSVAIVPEGCNRVTQHDEHVDFDDLVDVLVSPSIEMVGAELVISCFSAERLPPMDSLSGSCDPYFMVDFAGKADTKTKHVSNTLDPVFNEQLIVPVFLPRHGPPTSNRIRCCVWDYDNGPVDDDKIGVATILLSDVRDGLYTSPTYLNLYGCPRHCMVGGDGTATPSGGFFGGISNMLSSVAGVFSSDGASIARAMNAGTTPGSAWRGRVLLTATLRENVAEPRHVCNGGQALAELGRSPPHVSTEQFTLRAWILICNGLPAVASGQKVSVRVSCGHYEDFTQELKSEHGVVQWYEQLELDMQLPNDLSQIPDLFLDLLIAGERLGYLRVPLLDVDNQARNPAVNEVNGMMSVHNLPNARWHSLRQDKLGCVKDAACFPGSVLCCVGLSHASGRPIHSRHVHSTALRFQQPPDAPKEVETTPTAKLSKREKRQRASALEADIVMIQQNISKRKTEIADAKQRLKRELVVSKVVATGLKDTDFMGKIDPYCTMALGVGDTIDNTTRKKTQVIDNGGTNVTWAESMVFSDFDKSCDTLFVDVLDSDVGQDDHCGHLMLPLGGVFEAGKVKLKLELTGLNGEPDCGELQMQLEYQGPSPGMDDQVAMLVQDLQQMERIERTNRHALNALVEPKRDARLLRPEEEPYCLRVQVYQARFLPPSDANGLADPRLTASIGHMSRSTSQKYRTLFPRWYEILEFDGLKLPPQDYICQGLASELILELWDHDSWGRDDFMGRAHVSLQTASASVPDQPSWVPFLLLDSEDVNAGEVLLSLQLVTETEREIVLDRVPRPIAPSMRRCTLEIFVLGCRALKPILFGQPNCPLVQFSLGGGNSAAAGIGIKTKPSNTPSSSAPNFLEVIKIVCDLPEDPLFAPALNIRAFDRQFLGREALLGTSAIPLQEYLPWVDTTRARLLKRCQLHQAPSAAISKSLGVTHRSNASAGSAANSSPGAERSPLLTPAGANASAPDDADLDDMPMWRRNRLHFRRELEEEMASWHSDDVIHEPFDTWLLGRGVRSSGTDLIEKLTGGTHSTVGQLKGLLRIVEHSPNSGAGAAADNTDRPIPFPIEVAPLLKPSPMVVRCYVIAAHGLPALDSDKSSDPYLTVRLGNRSIGGSDSTLYNTCDPHFGRCLEFETVFPGPSKLDCIVYDHDTLGSDREIGRTCIDLEDRFYSQEWQGLGATAQHPGGRAALQKKPLEMRTLRLPGSRVSRGQMELWVEILTKGEAQAHQPVDISAPKKEEFQLRVCVFSTKNVPAMDILTQANDMFVTAHLNSTDDETGRPKEDVQSTDVHWRVHDGKGLFNYRMMFDVTLPQPAKAARPASLAIKAFDRDPLTFSSDLIGRVELNLDRLLFQPGLRKWRRFLATEKDIEAMSSEELRRQLGSLAHSKHGQHIRAAPPPIPANATREQLASMLRDFGQGRAGTIVRFPDSDVDKLQRLKRGATMVGETCCSAARWIKKKTIGDSHEDAEKPCTAWVELTHPSTGPTASRGRYVARPFCNLRQPCPCVND